mmetsp:Transcript_52054/g.145297  ORF Transcript_52054/g.145297 Transcript_52054/m.145297 type:complete len:251 (-) Transcript_52054:1745-2497(-)
MASASRTVVACSVRLENSASRTSHWELGSARHVRRGSSAKGARFIKSPAPQVTIAPRAPPAQCHVRRDTRCRSRKQLRMRIASRVLPVPSAQLLVAHHAQVAELVGTLPPAAAWNANLVKQANNNLMWGSLLVRRADLARSAQFLGRPNAHCAKRESTSTKAAKHRASRALRALSRANWARLSARGAQASCSRTLVASLLRLAVAPRIRLWLREVYASAAPGTSMKLLVACCVAKCVQQRLILRKTTRRA